MSRIPTPSKSRRAKPAPARITRDATLTAAYIDTLLQQQADILAKGEKAKQAYPTNSPYYGVPRAVLAFSDIEAEALVEWYEEEFKDKEGFSTGRCHRIVRSY